MKKLNIATLLPVLSQLGTYLKQGADHYASLKMAGDTAGPDVVAVYLQAQMSNWNPKVGGVEVLDDDTKAAGARFLAGVAIKLTQV